MNESEMRNIEAWLDRMMRSQEMADGYGAIMRRAERQRAEALAEAIRSLGTRLVDLGETVRRTAESCSAARLRHVRA
jgi:hypothetical protein